MNLSIPIFCWTILTALVVAVSFGCLITRMPQRELEAAERVLILLYITGSLACWAWHDLPPAWALLATLILVVYAGWHRRPA